MGPHNATVIKGAIPDEIDDSGPNSKWDAHDKLSWEYRNRKPSPDPDEEFLRKHGITIPEPESYWDFDLEGPRPRNDVVVRIGPDIINRKREKVNPASIDPTNKSQFPDLTPGAQSLQQQEWVAPHRRGIYQQEKQGLPRKQIASKVPEVKSQTKPVISEVKVIPNGLKDDAVSSSPISKPLDHTSQSASPELTAIHPPAKDQPSSPKLTGILRYFRPVGSAQTDAKEHAPAPPPLQRNPEPSPLQKASQGHLITKGADFLAYVEKCEVLNGPKKPTPGDNHKEKTVVPEPTASSPMEVSMASDSAQHKQEGNRRGTHGDASGPDEVVAGIHAMEVARPRSSRDSSNQSVRGRANSKLDAISVNLSFNDAFKGRNASANSDKSVVVFEGRRPPNPYKTDDYLGDYEPGQLWGWDGNWAPAPVEWDRRDLFDYRKPEHQNSIKNWVIDRYVNFKKGNCPSLKINEESIMMGHSLAVGLTHFGQPIDEAEHETFTAQDPFTLNKYNSTAKASIAYFVSHYERIFGPIEKAKPKKLTKAEYEANMAEAEAINAALRVNPFKPTINIYVRPARLFDLPQIQRIFNEWTEMSVVTSERGEVTEAQWRSRYEDCEEEQYPFIVAVLRHGHTAQKMEKIVGFAYAEDFGSERGMWRYTCELQFYADPHHLRKGIGKNLVNFALRALDSSFRYRQAIPYVYEPDELNRYDHGGARRVHHTVITFPYKDGEKEQSQWVWDWLARVFEFELHGDLKGIGLKGDRDTQL